MLTPQQLQDKLESLPNEIYQREKQVITARERVDLAKAEYDVAYSVALRDADAPNATEKKALAIIGASEIKNALIKAQCELTKQEAHHTALKNHYTSLRKIASIEIEIMNSKISGN